MGKLKKRSDGRYRRKYTDETGHVHYVVGRSEAEVNKKYNELKKLLAKGLDVSAQRDTVGDWIDQMLEIKQGDVIDSQYRHYKSVLSAFDRSMILSKVRAADIQAVITKLFDEGKAKRTLQFYRSAISQVFDLAVERKAIEYNPCAAVKIPKKAPQTTRRALTEKEQEYIRGTPHRAQTAAMIMLYAGLRRGEVIPLTWNDIDFRRKQITINKFVEKNNSGSFELKSAGKSDAAKRVVGMPDVLIEYLRKAPKEDLLICRNASGRMHSDTSWRRMWNSYMTDINFKYSTRRVNNPKAKTKIAKSKFTRYGVVKEIPEFTPHMLRHTYATNLYFSGVDVLTAKELLGHSDVKTTLGIYTHLDKVYKNKNISKYNEYLGGQIGGQDAEKQHG